MDIVKEGTGYLSTFFEGECGDASRPEERRSPKCTLLVSRYRLTRGPKSGRLHLKIDRDALEFENEAAMAAAIEDGGWFELPPEADGNPRYVPLEFDPKVLVP